VLPRIGLADEAWAQLLLRLLGLALGLVANFGVFLWVIARLARQHTPLRSAVRAAALGGASGRLQRFLVHVADRGSDARHPSTG
jgi:membrane protein